MGKGTLGKVPGRQELHMWLGMAGGGERNELGQVGSGKAIRTFSVVLWNLTFIQREQLKDFLES